jgi:hypothetical protein
MEISNILIAGAALIFVFFLFNILGAGSGRGGRVITRFTADFKILDPRFQTCRPEGDYCIFKEGKPHKIEIDVERLPLQKGEFLDVYINQQFLSRMTVEADLEAEFEHWSDGEVSFPQITEGDKIDIAYQGNIIISGVFHRK